MITRTDEAKSLVKHTSCDCKCKFNNTTCKSNQKQNNDKCQCKRKKNLSISSKKIIVGIVRIKST